jgi:antitoxin component YwqK of YwqJK toxin-antitoxin module
MLTRKIEKGLWLALAFALASALSGCSHKVLDYRNVQVVNGQIFASDANEPFTGTVTNFPDNEILRDQEGFANFAHVIAEADFPGDMQAAQILGITGLGVVTARTTAYCDVSVREGLLDGKTICKAPRSDVVGTKMYFKKGLLNGSLKYYDFSLSRSPLAEGSFEDGVPDGTQTLYGAKTGRKLAVVNWSKGVQDGKEEVYNDANGEVIKRLRFKDGKIDGDIVEYSADGKTKLHSVQITNGVKSGDEELYYPDGKHKEHSEWVDGKINGTVRRWDESSKVSQELTYKDGVQVQTEADNVRQALTESALAPAVSAVVPATNLDACVSAWTVAFRKERGEDAAVAADQLDEWKQWCEQGKPAPSS